MKKTLFSGKDIEVRYNGNIENKKSVIIFRCGGGLPGIFKDGTRIDADDPRFIALESAFANESVTEIYIAATHLHAYEVAEMETAIACIKPLLINSIANITIGFSMGGFAAINYSRDFNAKFIAFSPSATHTNILPQSYVRQQYIKSYGEKASKIENGYLTDREGYVFFDFYKELDRAHAFYIKNNTKARLVNLPFSGHSNIYLINSTFNIPQMVYGMLDNTFHLKDYRNRIIQNYHEMPAFDFVDFLVKRFIKNKPEADFLEYISEYISIDKINNLQLISRSFLKNGRKKEALAIIIRALKNQPNNKASLGMLYKCMDSSDMATSGIPEEIDISVLAKDLLIKQMYTRGEYEQIYKLTLEQKPDFITPPSYIMCAICNELYQNYDGVKDIIQTGLSKFPYNTALINFNKEYAARRTHFAEGMRKDLVGLYIFIDSLYEIVAPNAKFVPNAYSFRNVNNGKFLRHRFGKLEASSYEDNRLFKFDSTFFAYKIDKYRITLRCSNMQLTGHFVMGTDSLYIGGFGDSATNKLAKIGVFAKYDL